MIEEVEYLELELSLHPLRYRNVLYQRRISEKLIRPAEGVAANISKRGKRRQQESSGTVWRTDRTRHRCKQVDGARLGIKPARVHVEA